MALEIISYTEMLSLWKHGFRNGAIRRMSLLERGLFSAALNYARMKGQIVNRKLIAMINGVANLIRKSVGREIFKLGLKKADFLIKNQKMVGIFPCILAWVNNATYISWLGTELSTY
jgi:hypothetical protein